jgi:hypothetical protein
MGNGDSKYLVCGRRESDDEGRGVLDDGGKKEKEKRDQVGSGSLAKCK